jgi:RNA polymerase sigma-70 factor (ECF subfamily)
MMTKQTEQDDFSPLDLIARVARGETSAFESIVRRFERPLRAWLATQAPPAVDVDELAQLTFVVVFSKLREFEPGTDFAAWLFTIARFQLKTELTRLRRVADYHARFAPELLQRELELRSSESPELQQHRLDHLTECLESLGEPLLRYLTWRYEEEIPLEEMAARSGRSVSAIKKQLWQLRRRLHECIEARMTTEGEMS